MGLDDDVPEFEGDGEDGDGSRVDVPIDEVSAEMTSA